MRKNFKLDSEIEEKIQFYLNEIYRLTQETDASCIINYVTQVNGEQYHSEHIAKISEDDPVEFHIAHMLLSGEASLVDIAKMLFPSFGAASPPKPLGPMNPPRQLL